MRKAMHEGMHLPGKILFHGREQGLEVLGTDTQVLSGGRLARSVRTFLVLDDAVMVTWDDLQAYEPESFDFLLHTICSVMPSGEGKVTLQSVSGESCPLSFFSESSSSLAVEDVLMGETYKDGVQDGHLQGKCLKWQTEKVLRQKFGFTMGMGVQSSNWQTLDSGWENSIQIGAAKWSIWFNRMADGSVMHRNSIGTWRGIETDAYALVLREEGDSKTLYGIQASFLRREGVVIAASAGKAILVRTD
jgi:hypothetical protein